MKRYIYILSFVILGIILQQIIHSIMEVWYIQLLVSDFESFGLGLSWRSWLIIHHIYGAALLLAGSIWGYRMGKYFWPILYDENSKVRNPRPWRI